MAMSDDCSWKTDIRVKLALLFENDPKALTTILLFLDEEDNRLTSCTEDESNDISAWETLRYTIQSDAVFQNYAQRLADTLKKADEDCNLHETVNRSCLHLMETSRNSNEMALPAAYSWKEEVRGKLLDTFENHPETLHDILSYLDEDANASQDDGADVPYAWRTLYAAIDLDDTFKEYANSIAEEARKVNESDFSENTDHPSEQMTGNLNDTSDDYRWKDCIRGKLIDLLGNDTEMLCNILSYLDEEDAKSPDRDASIPDVWMILYSVIDSSEEFKEYAKSLIRYTRNTDENDDPRENPSKEMETLWPPKDDFSWKDDIRAKLVRLPEDDSETLTQYLEDEDEKYENEITSIPPVWEVLRSSYHSDDLFEKCIQHLMEDMMIAKNDTERQDNMTLSATQTEFLSDSYDGAPSNDFSWKDNIRRKLKTIFETDDESLMSILLYLVGEDNKCEHNDSTVIPPVWSILRFALYSDKVFQEYAKRIAEDTKRADKDKSFRESMDFLYNEMMKPFWNPEDVASLDDCSWKEDIRNKLKKMFEHDPEILESIFTQLEEEDKACTDNTTTSSLSVWTFLRAAFNPDNMNEEYADHCLEMLESFWNSENEFTWKDDIRCKLITVLENNAEGLTRVFDYLHEEDAGNQPVWEVLNSALYSDKVFQEYAECLVEDTERAFADVEFRKGMKQRYTQMLEGTWTSNDKTLPDDDSWKDDIRTKLLDTFENSPDSFGSIIFYLDEEEKAYKEMDGTEPPVWKLLKSALYSDETFQGCAERLAEDVKMAEQDVAFRDTMNLLYSQMLKPLEDPLPADHAQGFGFPSVSVTDLIPKPSENLVTSAVKNPRVVAILERASGVVAKPAFLAAATVVYLGIKAIINMRRWLQGKISGKRCVKEIIDNTASLAAGVVGGMAGAALGGLSGGPLGGITFCSSFGTILASSVMQCLCDRLTQWMFGIPKDEALENAYNFLGVNMTASNNEINKAYRKLCLQYHPDKSGGNSEDFLLLQIHIAVIRQARGET